MEVAVIEDEGRDERDELVYRARKTIVVRPPPVRPSEDEAPTIKH